MKTAIFTVVKNEQDYIEDFIKYHIDLGIDTLFIFEDIDSMSHEDITSKYPNVSLHSVTELINIETIKKLKTNSTFQSEYIKNGLLYIRDNYDYDWCFSIDCDEYITTEEPFPNILNDYLKHDAIMLQWKNYGCSGHIKKPVYDKPIWDIYTQECGYSSYDSKYCNCTKMCFNMKKLQERFIHGNHTALCNYVKPDFTWDRTKTVLGKIYLRHYITKSWEEYVWKLTKRGMMCKEHRKFDDFFEMHPNMIDNKEKLMEMVYKNSFNDIYL